MARTYKRDSRGRFAGGGGGSGGGGGRRGGGGKRSGGGGSVAQRKSAVVRRVSSNALAGRQNTSAARSYVRAQQGEKMRLSGGGKGNKAARRAAAVQAKAAQASRAAQFSRKAAPNTAKQKYKAARSAVRELKMYRGGRTDATVRNAQARVTRMERGRRSSRARI